MAEYYDTYNKIAECVDYIKDENIKNNILPNIFTFYNDFYNRKLYLESLINKTV